MRYDALLDNPLLKFDRLLVIERGAGNMGLPGNWESNSSLSTSGIDNRLCVLSPLRPDAPLATLYQPQPGRFVGDVDLHFHADRLLFSMPGANGRWQVHELPLGGRDSAAAAAEPRELTLIREPDVDNYDACYLPDGRILFTSTAPYIGVPCVYGGSHVTNLYLADQAGAIRQLTVDQEHNWCPTVLNNGRVLYLRWEYTDLPHAHSRRLFHMNPDGTGQMEYLSSNSYFPNSFFYARPIPGHPTQVVGIATGHHGNIRTGRLLIVDPARGRLEAEGVVQEIPGYGKRVEPLIRDQLADGVWPQFLHPFPLSGKYFLVSAKLTPNSLWGIYLVDVFDNLLLLKESPGFALLEPIPLQKTVTAPSITDRVDLQRTDAVVYMADVYQGGGLKGVPRGTVKQLRVFTYHFSYRGMGGLLGAIGMDGPWDIKRVLGTVPVEEDGSAVFRVPANTPISVQPLDAKGQALQLMRSWFTAMPGETLSCVGCHEKQNTGPPNHQTLAARRAPSEIAPWHGPRARLRFPPRGAARAGPALRQLPQRPAPPGRHAHRRSARDPNDHRLEFRDCRARQPGGGRKVLPAVRRAAPVRPPARHRERHPSVGAAGVPRGGHGAGAAAAQRPLWRPARCGSVGPVGHLDRPECSLPRHLDGDRGGRDGPAAGDAEARVVETLCRGRRRSRGDPRRGESGRRTAVAARIVRPRRNARPQVSRQSGDLRSARWLGRRRPATTQPVTCPGWPFAAAEAQRRQGAADQAQRTIDLDEQVKLELVRIPAGEFVMGDPTGPADEQPACRVKIDKPFWMGRCEVTNEQFARFDPHHDSHYETMHGYQFGMHGYPVNRPRQPAVRLSWNQATGFCRWLSQKTGRRFNLPTEAQWEYACRAGTATPFSFGDRNTDFSQDANLGDVKLRELALDTYISVHVVPQPNKYDDWVPKDERFNDGGLVSVDVGSYRANAWGLHDMHGNVGEWTRSAERPYPYAEDGRNEPAASGRRVVRGGSWYDRPQRCTSSFRLAYEPYAPVFNVGFRVILEEE